MHIYFMSRGIKHSIDEFINDLSRQRLPYKAIRPGEEYKGPQDSVLQVRVCPIQLWDVSFPKEHRDAMLTTLFGGNPETAGKPINDKHAKIAWAIRKGMGVDPIPEKWDTKNKVACVEPAHTEMIAIGMKEDYYKDGQEMI